MRRFNSYKFGRFGMELIEAGYVGTPDPAPPAPPPPAASLTSTLQVIKPALTNMFMRNVMATSTPAAPTAQVTTPPPAVMLDSPPPQDLPNTPTTQLTPGPTSTGEMPWAMIAGVGAIALYFMFKK